VVVLQAKWEWCYKQSESGFTSKVTVVLQAK